MPTYVNNLLLPPAAGLIAVAACACAAMAIERFCFPIVPGPKRIGCIDGLRGFLALGVLLHHFVHAYDVKVYGFWLPDQSRFFTLAGHAGVHVFFMITGFLFWDKLLQSQGRVEWRQLYLSRVFRIMPLYWFAVGVVFVLVLAGGGPTVRVPPADLLAQMLGWLFFFDTEDINGVAGTGRMLAYASWTLRYEWIFYLSLPLLAWMVRGAKRFPCLPAGCMVLLTLWALRDYQVAALNMRSSLFLYFVVGALGASLSRIPVLCRLAGSRWTTVLILIALVLLFTRFDSGYGLISTAVMSAIFIPIALGNTVFGSLTRKPLLLLGEMSYSIYLLHGLVLFVLFDLMMPNFLAIGTSRLQLSTGLCAAAVLTVLLAAVTFVWIELPFMRWSRQLTRQLATRRAESRA